MLEPCLLQPCFHVAGLNGPRPRPRGPSRPWVHGSGDAPNLPTKVLDIRGLDSSRILMLRGGILSSIGDLPESLSQAILVGRLLVGRLGVAHAARHEQQGTRHRRPPTAPAAAALRSDALLLHGGFLFFFFFIS